MKKFFHQAINDDIYLEFDEYMLNGGFPKTLEFPDTATRQLYTRGIIEEIFNKDVRTRNRVSNIAVFERVQSYIINNYSAPFSLANLLEVMNSEGIKTKAITLRKYIEDLKKAKHYIDMLIELESNNA